MRQSKIYDPIHGAEFLVQRGGSVNKLNEKYFKLLKEPVHKLEEDDRRMGHFTALDWHKGGAIWLSEKAGFGTVAHETLHAVYHVMRCIDVKLDDNTEEIFTYYQQFLVNEIMTKLFKWRI